MTKKQVYESLEELRADKRMRKRRLDRQLKALQRDAVDCVLPSNNALLSSDYSYMRYVGYGITAYKTFNFVRRAMSFVRKHRWK